MTKKITPADLPVRVGSGYPDPLNEPCETRSKRALGDAAGLTQFGVNLTTLPSGSWSALTHWHQNEDEFVYILSGTPTLVYGDTEELLSPGDCVGFTAGEEIGHSIQNRSDTDVTLIEVGTRSTDEKAFYPGLDLMADLSKSPMFRHLDGAPYPPRDKG